MMFTLKLERWLAWKFQSLLRVLYAFFFLWVLRIADLNKSWQINANANETHL